MHYDLTHKDGRIADGRVVAELTQALKQRGVPFHIAVDAAARVQAGDTVGVEIELVFSRKEFETKMEAQGIHAEWRGGEPRQPFTLNLAPNHERSSGIWPQAVGSALKTRGMAEDEADDAAVRLAAGDGIEGVVLWWVPSEDEELVIEQLEGYGAKATKVAGG